MISSLFVSPDDFAQLVLVLGGQAQVLLLLVDYALATLLDGVDAFDELVALLVDLLDELDGPAGDPVADHVELGERRLVQLDRAIQIVEALDDVLRVVVDLLELFLNEIIVVL